MQVRKDTHTGKHTDRQRRAHTQVPTYTNTNISPHRQIRKPPHTDTHRKIRTQENTHTFPHRQTQANYAHRKIRTPPHTDKYANLPTQTNTGKYAHGKIRTPPHTGRHAHIPTQTYKRAQTLHETHSDRHIYI